MTAETLKKAHDLLNEIDSLKSDLWKWEKSDGFSVISLNTNSTRSTGDIRYAYFIDFVAIKAEAIKWLSWNIAEKEKQFADLK